MTYAERKAAILLLMLGNPAEDWQRLTEHYREISDEELQELAGDFVDLTETAQQVLRNEMRNRGLDEPRAASEASKSSNRPAAPRWDRPGNPDPGDIQSDAAGEGEEDDLPREYTWKTPLCECESREKAWQLREVLRRAGIDSWTDRYLVEEGYIRVTVAADQLEEALEIASRPIPQEIIDQSKMEMPEFEPPKCPNCGARDPVLEGVDPFNTWQCEQCGKEWTESAGAFVDQEEKSEP
ncbi:MAG: hypothetical protein ACLP7O_04360 [Terracidiphilus sp.]